MKILNNEKLAVVSVNVELSIFELKRLKELQSSLESKNDLLDEKQFVSLKGSELKDFLEQVNLAASFLHKVCGDTPTDDDIDNSLFYVEDKASSKFHGTDEIV